MQPRTTAPDSTSLRHRPKTLTVFAAAFAAGAVLAYGVDRVVDVHVVQVEPQVESEPIFVALRSLPQGAPITVWDVALKDWPKAMLPTTALKADASFEGMVLRHPIREGQPLLTVQLVRDGVALPSMTVATLPPAAAPAPAPATDPQRPAPPAPPAGPVEQFVPATPAEQSSATAGVDPTARATEIAGIDTQPITTPRVTAVADADIDADIPADAAVDVTGDATPQAAAPATPDVAADMPPGGESPAAAAVEAEPSALEPGPPADPSMVAVSQPAAVAEASPPVIPIPTPAAEPTPAVTESPATAAVAGMPLAAPVPNLPTTDIERSLSAFGRRAAQPDERSESVLDRTNVQPPPARTSTQPRYHLVVPERIALAADASFAEQPEPQATPVPLPTTVQPQQQTTAAPQAGGRGTVSATGPNQRPQGSAPNMRTIPTSPRQHLGTQAVAKPGTKRQATSKQAMAKQAMAKPAMSKPASSAQGGRTTTPKSTTENPGKSSNPAGRGIGAWFPQFSGGNWQR